MAAQRVPDALSRAAVSAADVQSLALGRAGDYARALPRQSRESGPLVRAAFLRYGQTSSTLERVGSPVRVWVRHHRRSLRRALNSW